MKRFLFILATAFAAISCLNVGGNSEKKDVFINLTSDIQTSAHSVLMGLHVAQKALRNDMQATVFVNVEGVSIFAPFAEDKMCHGENLHTVLLDILAKGGTVKCCKHCLNSAGLDKSDLMQGTSIASETELINALSSDVVCLTY